MIYEIYVLKIAFYFAPVKMTGAFSPCKFKHLHEIKNYDSGDVSF